MARCSRAHRGLELPLARGPAQSAVACLAQIGHRGLKVPAALVSAVRGSHLHSASLSKSRHALAKLAAYASSLLYHKHLLLPTTQIA